MKKLIIYTILALFLISTVAALGVAPSRNDVFYEPRVEKELSFRIINNEHVEKDVLIILRGDLADYVDIPNKVHVDSDEYEKAVIYSLNMPKKLKPGQHTLEIILVEGTNENNEEGNILLASVGVIHKLNLKVPYPDEHLEGILYVSQARPDEKVTFTVTLSNVGSKDLKEIGGSIVILGPNNQPISQISTNEIDLEQKRSSKVTSEWIANVEPGTYTAQAIIEYGKDKVLMLEKTFDVGEPLVDIKDLTIGSFKLGTVAKLDITVENLWNKDIEEVYGKTLISDEDKQVISEYKTSTIKLPGLGIKDLISYWDTEGISEGKYLISIRVHYLGRVREKTYELLVEDDKIRVQGAAITGEVAQESVEVKDRNYMFIIVALAFIIIMTKLVLDFVVKLKKPPTGKEQDSEINELRSYIKKKLKEGYSPATIRDNLTKKGWNKKLIDTEMIKLEDDVK